MIDINKVKEYIAQILQKKAQLDNKINPRTIFVALVQQHILPISTQHNSMKRQARSTLFSSKKRDVPFPSEVLFHQKLNKCIQDMSSIEDIILRNVHVIKSSDDFSSKRDYCSLVVALFVSFPVIADSIYSRCIPGESPLINLVKQAEYVFASNWLNEKYFILEQKIQKLSSLLIKLYVTQEPIETEERNYFMNIIAIEEICLRDILQKLRLIDHDHEKVFLVFEALVWLALIDQNYKDYVVLMLKHYTFLCLQCFEKYLEEIILPLRQTKTRENFVDNAFVCALLSAAGLNSEKRIRLLIEVLKEGNAQDKLLVCNILRLHKITNQPLLTELREIFYKLISSEIKDIDSVRPYYNIIDGKLIDHTNYQLKISILQTAYMLDPDNQGLKDIIMGFLLRVIHASLSIEEFNQLADLICVVQFTDAQKPLLQQQFGKVIAKLREIDAQVDFIQTNIFNADHLTRLNQIHFIPQVNYLITALPGICDCILRIYPDRWSMHADLFNYLIRFAYVAFLCQSPIINRTRTIQHTSDANPFACLPYLEYIKLLLKFNLNPAQSGLLVDLLASIVRSLTLSGVRFYDFNLFQYSLNVCFSNDHLCESLSMQLSGILLYYFNDEVCKAENRQHLSEKLPQIFALLNKESLKNDDKKEILSLCNNIIHKKQNPQINNIELIYYAALCSVILAPSDTTLLQVCFAKLCQEIINHFHNIPNKENLPHICMCYAKAQPESILPLVDLLSFTIQNPQQQFPLRIKNICELLIRCAMEMAFDKVHNLMCKIKSTFENLGVHSDWYLILVIRLQLIRNAKFAENALQLKEGTNRNQRSLHLHVAI